MRREHIGVKNDDDVRIATAGGSASGIIWLVDWFAVRCMFRTASDDGGFEERVTLWRADSFDAAVARAEQEARGYARRPVDALLRTGPGVPAGGPAR